MSENEPKTFWDREKERLAKKYGTTPDNIVADNMIPDWENIMPPEVKAWRAREEQKRKDKEST